MVGGHVSALKVGTGIAAAVLHAPLVVAGVGVAAVIGVGYAVHKIRKNSQAKRNSADLEAYKGAHAEAVEVNGQLEAHIARQSDEINGLTGQIKDMRVQHERDTVETLVAHGVSVEEQVKTARGVYVKANEKAQAAIKINDRQGFVEASSEMAQAQSKLDKLYAHVPVRELAEIRDAVNKGEVLTHPGEIKAFANDPTHENREKLAASITTPSRPGGESRCPGTENHFEERRPDAQTERRRRQGGHRHGRQTAATTGPESPGRCGASARRSTRASGRASGPLRKGAGQALALRPQVGSEERNRSRHA